MAFGLGHPRRLHKQAPGGQEIVKLCSELVEVGQRGTKYQMVAGCVLQMLRHGVRHSIQRSRPAFVGEVCRKNPQSHLIRFEGGIENSRLVLLSPSQQFA